MSPQKRRLYILAVTRYRIILLIYPIITFHHILQYLCLTPDNNLQCIQLAHLCEHGWNLGKFVVTQIPTRKEEKNV